MSETLQQQEARLITQLQAMRCPECQGGLHFGGWVNCYQYVQFDQINERWQDGKNRSDGNSLECSRDGSHKVESVIPENWDEINDFLHNL